MTESKGKDDVQVQSCGRICPCCRAECGGCGRCCGKTVEYVVIDSFVWPPWPDREEK